MHLMFVFYHFFKVKCVGTYTQKISYISETFYSFMTIQDAKCVYNLTIPINENLHAFKLAQVFFYIKNKVLYKIIRFHHP